MKYKSKTFTIYPGKTERKCVGLDCEAIGCLNCIKINGKYTNFKAKRG